MRPMMTMMLLTLILVMGCAQPDSRQSSSESVTVQPSQETPQETITMAEETLSPQAQQTFLEAVGSQQGLSTDQLQITKTEEADWPDACLGLAGPDEFCAQMMVPGWAIEVTNGQQTWKYRTDLDMTQVKLDE